MLSNPRPRVLYVDNDEDSREMLSTLMNFSQIEVKAVASAAQALSLIEAERFELYLIESWLPNIDGFELCHRMRAVDAHTPILFFSGAAYEADKKRGLAAGANAYVVKPDVGGLVRRIAEFVSAERDAARIIPMRAQRENLPPGFAPSRSTERYMGAAAHTIAAA